MYKREIRIFEFFSIHSLDTKTVSDLCETIFVYPNRIFKLTYCQKIGIVKFRNKTVQLQQTFHTSYVKYKIKKSHHCDIFYKKFVKHFIQMKALKVIKKFVS